VNNPVFKTFDFLLFDISLTAGGVQ